MSLVRTESHGELATVTLARPERRNAVSTQLVDDLLVALADVRGASAIVLAGEGSTFCAGQDLREAHAARGAAPDRDYLRRLQDVPRTIRRLDAPVVAAVQGHALGAGMEIAMAADLLVLAPDAVLGLPEVEVGLAVGGAASTLLPQLVGLPRAKELVLLGRRVQADEAVALGLANEVHRDGPVIGRARQLAGELASRPPLALAWAKRSLHAGLDLDGAYAIETEAMWATGSALHAASNGRSD